MVFLSKPKFSNKKINNKIGINDILNNAQWQLTFIIAKICQSD